jgi:hypothetical protein
MKTGIQMSPTIASDGLNGSAMTMSAKGADMAAYFLRDRIYSDKILAPIREYICNALDEHTKYNIKTPVQVSIVKDEDSNYVWKVRDYAKGLDEHSIRNIFGMYFESTKSGNNDQIGGFGIGSKAFHCYADTFYVDSYFNGTHTKYACVLGGGQKGVPVGEIYSIHSEPTTETGIEISASINRYDVSSFHSKTAQFVQRYSNPDAVEFRSVYARVNEVIKPFKPIITKKIRNYTLNAFDASNDDVAAVYSMSSNYAHTRKVCNYISIRMGGVVYETMFVSYDCTMHVAVVIDVPIGTLSIPISREGIEKTPATEKVYAEIRNAILDLCFAERKGIKPQPFEDYTTVKFSNNTMIGEMFEHKASHVLPDTYDFIRRVTKSPNPNFTGSPTIDAVKVTTIYTIAYTRATSMWLKRFQHTMFADEKFAGFAWMYELPDDKLEEFKKSTTLDLSNIKFVSIKSLKLPKLPSETTATGKKRGAQYAVYRGWGRKLGTYDAASLFAHQAANFSKIDYTKDNWHETVDDMNALNAFTIDLVTDRYRHGDGILYANTAKLVDAAHLINFISAESAEYIAAKNRIKTAMEEKLRRERVMHDVRSSAINTEYSSRVVKYLKRNPDASKRLIDRCAKFKNEDSPRGRILRLMNNYNTISRSDLRALLNLK